MRWRTSQPNSWPLVTAGSCVGVKHPGPPSPWPTRTPGMIMACTAVTEHRYGVTKQHSSVLYFADAQLRSPSHCLPCCINVSRIAANIEHRTTQQNSAPGKLAWCMKVLQHLDQGAPDCTQQLRRGVQPAALPGAVPREALREGDRRVEVPAADVRRRIHQHHLRGYTSRAVVRSNAS